MYLAVTAIVMSMACQQDQGETLSAQSSREPVSVHEKGRLISTVAHGAFLSGERQFFRR